MSVAAEFEPAPAPLVLQEVANDDAEWLASQVEQLTDELKTLTVSEWAEEKRILPRSVTPMAGHYSFSIAPFLKEIADCMSANSPVQVVDLMKGAQIGATVGVLENTIGYLIDHIKSDPAMLMTADKGLAELRIDKYIMPMVQHSNFGHLIQANEEGTKRTGRNKDSLEWAGGGYLLPFGAKNADKLRSTSIRYLLEDEVDAYPAKVANGGDPQKLGEARTRAYMDSRKILRLSTPLIKGVSRIAKGHEKGDQRKYLVPCKSCGHYQELRFNAVDKETGKIYGLHWEMEDGQLKTESVKYYCVKCGHAHSNADKSYMLPRGYWQPTKKAISNKHRSYHISALYSPIGMYTWEAIVLDWLDAWDVEQNVVKDINLLQEFYNNNLGLPFEVFGSRVRFRAVSGHRRQTYKMGQIPNGYAKQHSGSRILFLTCQVDVHKQNLAVAVMGWTERSRCYLIDYWRFVNESQEDDCTELSNPVWQRLRELIDDKVYSAADGAQYKILTTFIDAGYANDTVATFAADYEAGVYPILGRERPSKSQRIAEFGTFESQSGAIGFRIIVDHYKDRMAPVLRREWHEESGLQNQWHFNAPVDTTDKQLTELTAEVRREKTDEKGHVSWEWHRPGNARNELWDLLGYGYCAVEALAWDIWVNDFENESVHWDAFWQFAAHSENNTQFGRLNF